MRLENYHHRDKTYPKEDECAVGKMVKHSRSNLQAIRDALDIRNGLKLTWPTVRMVGNEFP